LVIQQELQDKIQVIKDKKKKLKAEKNQLLDFAEETVQKQQQEEALKVRLQSKIAESEQRYNEVKDQRDAYRKDKENQEDLIK